MACLYTNEYNKTDKGKVKNMGNKEKNILSIVFDATIHNTDAGNFAIPSAVCDLLNIKDQMTMNFVVDDMDGVVSHEKATTSGKEVRIGTGSYPNGQRVRITLFNPNYLKK